MRSIIIVPLICLSLSSFEPAIAQTSEPQAQTVSVGRYARVRTELQAPEQEIAANPMKTVVAMAFPKETVLTVGDAVEHLLMRTGYSLADNELSSAQARLMAFTLPESQRRLDYVTVEQALVLLGGESYAPQIDHLYRSVSFGVRPSLSPEEPTFTTVLQAQQTE